MNLAATAEETRFSGTERRMQGINATTCQRSFSPVTDKLDTRFMHVPEQMSVGGFPLNSLQLNLQQETLGCWIIGSQLQHSAALVLQPYALMKVLPCFFSRYKDDQGAFVIYLMLSTFRLHLPSIPDATALDTISLAVRQQCKTFRSVHQWIWVSTPVQIPSLSHV